MAVMTQPIVIVDAFTTKPFAGNPAAICILRSPASADWMQAVAAEMNLSETAFVVARGNDDGFDLRWFTPRFEVDLCGHATLASAHVLWTSKVTPVSQIRFHTRSGVLVARRDGDWIALDFPSDPPHESEPPAGLTAALGVTPIWTGRGKWDVLIVVERAQDVRDLNPDFGPIAAMEMRAVTVTAPSDQDDADFVSRFFAPAAGINEDPVTGSAHCMLGPFWARRLNKTSLVGYQASYRGGFVRVAIGSDRVELAGQARVVMNGHLVDGAAPRTESAK